MCCRMYLFKSASLHALSLDVLSSDVMSECYMDSKSATYKKVRHHFRYAISVVAAIASRSMLT